MSPIALAKALLRDHRFRFLLVGGFNTGFGFLVFVIVELTLGHRLDLAGHSVIASLATLVVSHIVAAIVAFVLYRRFVFKVTGNVLVDFLRFESVYLVSLVVNAIVLPLAVEWGAPRILAQAVITAVMTVVSYVGHRFFSFRRRPDEAETEGRARDEDHVEDRHHDQDGREDAQESPRGNAG